MLQRLGTVLCTYSLHQYERPTRSTWLRRRLTVVPLVLWAILCRSEGGEGISSVCTASVWLRHRVSLPWERCDTVHSVQCYPPASVLATRSKWAFHIGEGCTSRAYGWPTIATYETRQVNSESLKDVCAQKYDVCSSGHMKHNARYPRTHCSFEGEQLSQKYMLSFLYRSLYIAAMFWTEEGMWALFLKSWANVQVIMVLAKAFVRTYFKRKCICLESFLTARSYAGLWDAAFLHEPCRPAQDSCTCPPWRLPPIVSVRSLWWAGCRVSSFLLRWWFRFRSPTCVRWWCPSRAPSCFRKWACLVAGSKK